eukprot:gene23150-biopygen1236
MCFLLARRIEEKSGASSRGNVALARDVCRSIFEWRGSQTAKGRGCGSAAPHFAERARAGRGGGGGSGISGPGLVQKTPRLARCIRPSTASRGPADGADVRGIVPAFQRVSRWHFWLSNHGQMDPDRCLFTCFARCFADRVYEHAHSGCADHTDGLGESSYSTSVWTTPVLHSLRPVGGNKFPVRQASGKLICIGNGVGGGATTYEPGRIGGAVMRAEIDAGTTATHWRTARSTCLPSLRAGRREKMTKRTVGTIAAAAQRTCSGVPPRCHALFCPLTPDGVGCPHFWGPALLYRRTPSARACAAAYALYYCTERTTSKRTAPTAGGVTKADADLTRTGRGWLNRIQSLVAYTTTGMHHTQTSPRQVVRGRMGSRQFNRHLWNGGQPYVVSTSVSGHFVLHSQRVAGENADSGNPMKQGRASAHTMVYGCGNGRRAGRGPGAGTALLHEADCPNAKRARRHPATRAGWSSFFTKSAPHRAGSTLDIQGALRRRNPRRRKTKGVTPNTGVLLAGTPTGRSSLCRSRPSHLSAAAVVRERRCKGWLSPGHG